MKKFLLSAAAIGIMAFTQVNAQCTPGNINSDFQPLIATSLPAAQIGSAYSTTILFKAPASITISASDIPSNLLPAQIAPFIGLLPASFTVAVNSMLVGPISGQPAGLTGTLGGGTGGTFTPGEQGCMGIAGTPTAGGNFVVDLNVQYNITIDASALGLPLSGTFPIPQPIPSPQAKTYNISVPTSIEELDVTAFDLTNNAPNPFSDKTNILFSTPKQANVELTVFNMLGKMVYQNSYPAKQGKNAIEFSAEKLSGGLYIYNLSNGAELRTGKMIVTK
jgi:hypothetical protein